MAIVACLAATLAACSRREPRKAPIMAPAGGSGATISSNRFAGTPEARWPDGAVARGVRRAISAELGVRATAALKIDVKHGVALLSGIASSLLEKKGAGAAAESVRGVRAVVNEIEVKPPTLPDRTIADDVRNSLRALPFADRHRVAVNVRGGVVTLTGLVDSEQQSALVAHVAAGARGVIVVHDQVSVRPPPQRTDAAIMADVKSRLRWALPLDESSIIVEVSVGTVILRGQVATPTDFNRAAMLAQVTGANAVDTSALRVDPSAFPDEPRAPAVLPAADEAVAQAVRDALFYDPRLVPAGVSVQVRHGRATLDGKVSNLLAKRAAMQDAIHTVGIARVTDLVTVDTSTAPVSDRALAARVTAALARDPLDDLKGLAVDAVRGRVRLRGHVAAELAHERALEVASSVPGVQALTDQITVDGES